MLYYAISPASIDHTSIMAATPVLPFELNGASEGPRWMHVLLDCRIKSLMTPADTLPVPSPGEDEAALEREALRAAVARGDADIAAGRTVPHERVRAWLLDWITGGTAPMPLSTDTD